MLGETRNSCINPRWGGSLEGEDGRSLSPLLPVLYSRISHRPLVCSFFCEVNVFKNLVALWLCGADGIPQEGHGKKYSNRRSTWRSQFGRYALLGEKSSPDSRITRARNFLAEPEEISTREWYDAAFKYRSNSPVRVCTRPPTCLWVAVSPQESWRKGPYPLNEAHYLAPWRDRSFGSIARWWYLIGIPSPHPRELYYHAVDWLEERSTFN